MLFLVCLIQIDDQTILTDPVFSDRAFPVSFAGPKQFATEVDFQPEDLLQKIDAVLISHDHYDHLDYQSIKALHPWQEPIRRLLRKAEELSAEVTTTRIGESFSPDKERPQCHWWE